MKYIIDGKEVEITDWEQVEIIDRHDSGSIDWMVKGYDEDGNEYYGNCNYQHGEQGDVIEIELME